MLKCHTKRWESNIITLRKVAAEITPSFQNQYTISPCSRSILCEDSEYSILGPPSSICPRLSWRRLKAGSRCRLGQQVLLSLSKVSKKYLLYSARNQPVLRPADKISKHCIYCNYSGGDIYTFTKDHIQISTIHIHRHICHFKNCFRF